MSSSLDVDQALHARARWRKAVLVPLWTAQVFLLLCSMGIFAYRLAETLEHYEERNQLGEVPVVEVVWQAANVGFNLAALILTMVEIARLATERLTPFTMVFTNAIKLTLALAMLALDIVARTQDMDGEWSIVGLPLDIAFLVAALGTAIYGFTTYRRLAKYDDYLVTANTNANTNSKPYTSYHAADNSLELGAPYSKPVPRTGVQPYSSYSDADYSSSYPSQTQPAVAPGNNNEPTAGLTLKQQADRAMGHEFGWDTNGTTTTIPMTPPTPNLHPNLTTTTSTISGPAHTNPSTTGTSTTHGSSTDIEGNSNTHRSGSVVLAAGTVHVHRGVAVVNSPTAGSIPGPGQLHGQRSWVTERGVIAEEGEGEGDEFDEYEEEGGGEYEDGGGEGRQWADAGRGQAHGVLGRGEEDREALLGSEGR